MSRVVTAMSGGVDSSVAAALLKEAGHEVIGLFMRHGEQSPAYCDVDLSLPVLGNKPSNKQGCCGSEDAADARRVADRLDVPFYAMNMDRDFGRIMDYFTAEYTAGRTPNPCVMCNNWLKFGKLFEYADSIGADFVASGHYARLSRIDGRPALLRGIDDKKDQAYVLFGVAPERLERMLLPIGEFHKDDIRQMARDRGLPVAEKADSQEICFVPDGDYAAFVRRRRGELDQSGEIVLTDGRVVGQHAGVEQYTIGQRKGLGLAFAEPHYVVRIDVQRRQVVIGPRAELAQREVHADRTNWLVEPPLSPRRCTAKIRYNTPPRPAVVQALADNRLHVTLDEPQDGVAPGQAVVCYDGDRVLGGGWIV